MNTSQYHYKANKNLLIDKIRKNKNKNKQTNKNPSDMKGFLFYSNNLIPNAVNRTYYLKSKNYLYKVSISKATLQDPLSRVPFDYLISNFFLLLSILV